MNYNESTRQRVADIALGLHVQTTDGVLVAANFTATAQTELFNIYGRIAVKQLFIELTSAAAAEATVVGFNVTFTTPVIALNAISGDCAAITSLGAYGRITFVGGVVATSPVITDSAGLTDVETAGKMHILGGVSSAGVLTVGTIGMLASTVTQTGTIAATAHLFYFPMCKGSYASAVL